MPILKPEEEAVVEHCYREADGDLGRAYQLVTENTVGARPFIVRIVRDGVREKFVDAAIERIGDAHPFNGKSKFYRCVQRQGPPLYNIGIYSDGRLSNPNNYPEAEVRAALRWAGAYAEINRREGAVKAGETRAAAAPN
jgi:hypothetical protein